MSERIGIWSNSNTHIHVLRRQATERGSSEYVPAGARLLYEMICKLLLGFENSNGAHRMHMRQREIARGLSGVYWIGMHLQNCQKTGVSWLKGKQIPERRPTAYKRFSIDEKRALVINQFHHSHIWFLKTSHRRMILHWFRTCRLSAA